MTQVSKYGFIHDKATADSTLGVSDAGNGTFYVIFAEPMTEEHAMFDLTINGHVYSITGTPANTRTKFYWTLGTSKDKTQVDFVDKKPVAEATEAWPTITAEAATVQFTASTFSGGTDTYPTQLTQLNGVDGKPIKDISMSVSTTADDTKEPQKEESPMADHTEAARKGCNFDEMTARATHGKRVILMVVPSEQYVTDHEGVFENGVPFLVAGQNGLTVSVEAETAESPTKDGTGEWLTQTAGQKSWSISTDGLWALDDEGRNLIVDALQHGTLVCAMVCTREETGAGIKYQPIRKGMAIPTSDELDAPVDDNVTYSVELTGTGELWMIETASTEEIEAMTMTVTDDELA